MSLAKLLIHYTYRPILLWYLRKDRRFAFQGLNLLVKKGVFHPGFFFSTKLLVKRLSKEHLKGKTVLELGCGSGLISLCCARNGATVTATDINPDAVLNTKMNAATNNLNVNILLSDMFEHLREQTFDYLVVNPPYYPKAPSNLSEQAWYCGPNHEYFARFFRTIGPYMHSSTKVFMSLSEDCDIERIQSLSVEHGYRMETDTVQRTMWEVHYIFQIKAAQVELGSIPTFGRASV